MTTATDTVAAAIIQAAQSHNFTPDQTIACLATAIQESDLGAADPNIFQQDASYPDRGTMAGNITGFFDRLIAKMTSPGASLDIWKNIFWLQQAPAYNSADAAYTTGRQAYLIEIQSRTNDATALYDRLTMTTPPTTPTATGRVLLTYDHSIERQENAWDCGPASTEIVLTAQGIAVSQDTLIPLEGTTENGTDDVDNILPVLNQYTPAGQYVAVHLPTDPPSPQQVAALGAAIVNSINAGYGCIFNIEVPPNNYPVGVLGTPSPSYCCGLVQHYIAGMGYDYTDPNNPCVFIADPGFSPNEYFVTVAQLASMITPHGYLYATAQTSGPPPTPAPTTVTSFYVDVSNNNWGDQNLTAAGQQNLNKFLAAFPNQGFAGIVHKMSQGTGYRDPYGPLCQTWCQQNNVPFLGYHWVTTDNPTAQVQNWLAAGGGANVMFDVEAGPPSSGDMPNFWAVVHAFNAAGVNVQLAYMPNWYWQQIGQPDLSGLIKGNILLVSSAYPAGATADFAYNLYYNDCGGDTGTGWNGYGGATPSAWQFSSAGIVVSC